MACSVKYAFLVLALAGFYVQADDLSFKDEVVRDEEWLDPANMFVSKSAYNVDTGAGSRVAAVDDEDVVVRPLSTR